MQTDSQTSVSLLMPACMFVCLVVYVLACLIVNQIIRDL